MGDDFGMLGELHDLVEKYHPQGPSEVLSTLTAVLVGFAIRHNVEIDTVIEATRASWDAFAQPARTLS